MPSSSMPRDVTAARRRVWRRTVLLLVAALWLGTALWQTNKPLPPGVHVNGSWYRVATPDVTFIADVTSADAYGRPIVSQAIFDEVLRVVNSARSFIVLDYFLIGAQGAAANGAGTSLRPIAAELRDALI